MYPMIMKKTFHFPNSKLKSFAIIINNPPQMTHVIPDWIITDIKSKEIVPRSTEEEKILKYNGRPIFPEEIVERTNL